MPRRYRACAYVEYVALLNLRDGHVLDEVSRFGASGVIQPLPKYLIAGISIRYESTPPANMIEAMRGPMI